MVDVLPARGRLIRQGHPRDHPGTSVPEGGDVRLLPRGGGSQGARSTAGLAGADACRSGTAVPGDRHGRRRSGTSAARKYDCEAWLPSQQRFMEVTSTSNCTTFQARRLNIRERTDSGNRTAATLNGTLGTTRWLVALLENHQRPDGSVRVPTALQPYLGGRELLEPAAQAARA